MALTEFDLIHQFFSGMDASDHVLLGVGDDAAIIDITDGWVLQVSTDTVTEGVHFLPDCGPSDIAYRAVMTAASDLAAMGAAPRAMVLALSLPELDTTWLEAFCTGLRAASADARLPLVGGDTTRGPLVVTVTVMGATPTDHSLLRSGAAPGDRLCVSGTLGDAAAGLALLRGDLAASNAADAAFLKARFLRPTARIALGESLRELATAAIDISDGLLADSTHLATKSGVALQIDHRLLPRSTAFSAVIDPAQQLGYVLGGGDDYELLFTLPHSADLPEGCTEIGRVVAGSGVSCDGMPTLRGYDHFGH
ncbi:thiamine-phosphate kinase [Luminiphilus sp.]|nr:thiamine-phosphate kinase [Luminiphilus sp.]